MNIKYPSKTKIAKMKIEGILDSENAYLLQEKLNDVLKSDHSIRA